MGLNTLKRKKIEKIKPFKKVILAFDNDGAGQDFTYKAAQELIKNKIPFGCVTLLTKDVAEHYETAGNLTAVLNSVRSGYKWPLNYITPKMPFEELTVGEKDKAMAKCKDFIESIAASAGTRRAASSHRFSDFFRLTAMYSAILPFTSSTHSSSSAS